MRWQIFKKKTSCYAGQEEIVETSQVKAGEAIFGRTFKLQVVSLIGVVKT